MPTSEKKAIKWERESYMRMADNRIFSGGHFHTRNVTKVLDSIGDVIWILRKESVYNVSHIIVFYRNFHDDIVISWKPIVRLPTQGVSL